MPHSVESLPNLPLPNGPLQNELPRGERYWNCNLPETRWTEECPDYLLGQGQKNMGILSSRQEEYVYLTWLECKGIVETMQIGLFHRPPLDLRRYLHFIFRLKQQYGSIITFVQQERLHWKSISPSAELPFTNPSDYRILYNDWPYGLDPDITHLVVWTKFLLDDDPATGLLTSEYRDLIETFVQKTFCNEDGISRDNLIWFKNWGSLKSVHALEHFHIMLYQASADFLDRITEHDKPLSNLLLDL